MLRWIRRIAVVLAVVVLVVLVAGGGLAVLTIRASFPQVSGEVTVPGLEAAVDVRRDEWGIPRITAESASDLFLAQGYVHAQERFWEMDFRRHITAGRLSELFGESQVDTDVFIRTLGWRRVAEQELELLDPVTIGYLEAYAAGVNAYLADRSGAALSLEYAVLGLQNAGYEPEPWTPLDSVAWLKAMAWELSGNMDVEIQRVMLASRLSDEQIAELDPPYPFDRHPVIVPEPANSPSSSAASAARTDARATARSRTDLGEVAARLAPVAVVADRVDALVAGAGGAGIGSNSFVVSGSRTVTGLPILANDPHLAPSMPGIWMQMGLHCRELSEACPFDVSGFTFSGFPGVVLGHNDRLAWGFTNLGPDVQDLYLEDVQGDEYRSGNQMRDLEIRTETIQVAGGEPVTIRVRSTEHGPLISDAADWYAYVGIISPVQGEPLDSVAAPDVALQWTALTPSRTADAVFGLNQADDFGDLRDAARLFAAPSQNIIFADVDGHIGYQTPGVIPIRRSGDGKWPVPGWDRSYGWDGFVDFEDLPWVLDPQAGYIVTANNAVVGPDFGVFLTDDWALGDRAARLVELLESNDALDVDSARQIAFDNHGPLADVLVPALVALPERVTFTDGTRAVLEGLAHWDGQQLAESPDAAFVNAVWRHLLARTFHDELLYSEIYPDGGDRWVEVMRTVLDDSGSAWWDDVNTGDAVEGRDEMLDAAVGDAMADLEERFGADPTTWRWGAMHALLLRNESFGKSGIGPIEWLFNRGPFETSGGQDVVNATGWRADLGYEVEWVPSMRMVIDLSDFDASRYVNLTGVSGHAFGDHYDDQVALWSVGESTAWPFSPAAVEAASVDQLTLLPD